ncbi:MAG: M48 family metallopeptidase [Planctomycetales bacterium]|nr:M48 family metallopeptidase [Planctomycetales bacterium]
MIENSQPDGGYLLRHGSLSIPFQIEFGARSRLTIHVHPEMRLQVLAPAGKSKDAVLERVESKSAWIAKQWRFFEQYQPAQPKPQYINGETHRYLGRQYRLKVRKADKTSVKLAGKFLHVSQPDTSDRNVTEQLVSQWYRLHAESTFARRTANCVEKCKSLKLTALPKISVRQMSRRWGSCTKAGNITLNLDLIRVPIHCIDYVIIHELCHLKIHDHSPSFYRTLTRILPDWESRKERLESQDWS